MSLAFPPYEKERSRVSKHVGGVSVVGLLQCLLSPIDFLVWAQRTLIFNVEASTRKWALQDMKRARSALDDY